MRIGKADYSAGFPGLYVCVQLWQPYQVQRRGESGQRPGRGDRREACAGSGRYCGLWQDIKLFIGEFEKQEAQKPQAMHIAG